MRRTLIAILVIGSSFAAPPLASQHSLPPLRIGGHVAGNMMNGPFDLYRVGAQLIVPVGPRIALYPAAARFLDEAEWELSAAVRYRPFGPREGISPFYLGLGITGIGWGDHTTGYDQWIIGLELPGRVSPYVELQFLGPALRLLDESHDWGVQAHAGITWAVR